MFENIMLVLLLLTDVACWWEARRSTKFQRDYLDLRKAWYAQRLKQPKKNETATSDTAKPTESPSTPITKSEMPKVGDVESAVAISPSSQSA